jgi:hypothetical protein
MDLVRKVEERPPAPERRGLLGSALSLMRSGRAKRAA